MRVIMTAPHRSEDGLSIWNAGTTQYPSTDYGRLLVQERQVATDPDGVLATGRDNWLTAAQVQAVQALVDGSGVDVSFTRVHDGLALGYVLDAGSGNVLPVMRITINAATDVIAATRIAAGGANTFETSITGAATAGQVLAISVGPGKITSVHIGSSLGASQALDADGTATVNEIGKWSCLESDDCNVVYVRFAAPRGSGRYCDVSIVGKARA